MNLGEGTQAEPGTERGIWELRGFVYDPGGRWSGTAASIPDAPAEIADE
jgi:hypothetical protein